MVGTGMALLTALAWAGSTTTLKFLTAKIDTVSLNALRLWFASVPILSCVFILGRGSDLIHTSFLPLFFVAVSGILALALGDTLFIKSSTFVDASRAFPITQCTFFLLTMTVSLQFLEESFTWFNIIGAFLVAGGVYLVSVAGKEAKTSSHSGTNVKRIIQALTASLAWTTGAVTLTLGVTEMDAFVAAAIRTPASAITVTGLVISRTRKREMLQFKKYGRRNVALTFCVGALSYGVASVSLRCGHAVDWSWEDNIDHCLSPNFHIILLHRIPQRTTNDLCQSGYCYLCSWDWYAYYLMGATRIRSLGLSLGEEG